MTAIKALRWILGSVAAAAASALFYWGTQVHLRNACTELDTPYLRLCQDRAASGEPLRQELRDRIAHNPGDANAWTRLLASEPQDHRAQVLQGAAALAPNNHNVARWRAAEALQAGRADEGVALMIQILRYRPYSDVARVLAQIARTPEGLALLRRHLPSAGQWLSPVLHAGEGLKIPPGEFLPLVAAAMQQKTLPEAARRNYMRVLKARGDWLDAYGLWVAHIGKQVPLLYNGSFNQAIEPDGFDWELSAAPRSRSGAVVALQPAARRGQVLDVEFTGRSFTLPLARQQLFARPGRYRLRGEYMAAKLRSEQGLNWTVTCTAGRKGVAGRTAALQDTAGVWKPLELDFTIPADCGIVATLELRPVADFEATAGMRGRIAFDGFGLDPGSP